MKRVPVAAFKQDPEEDGWACRRRGVGRVRTLAAPACLNTFFSVSRNFSTSGSDLDLVTGNRLLLLIG